MGPGGVSWERGRGWEGSLPLGIVRLGTVTPLHRPGSSGKGAGVTGPIPGSARHVASLSLSFLICQVVMRIDPSLLGYWEGQMGGLSTGKCFIDGAGRRLLAVPGQNGDLYTARLQEQIQASCSERWSRQISSILGPLTVRTCPLGLTCTPVDS